MALFDGLPPDELPREIELYDGLARFYDLGMEGFDEDINLYQALAQRNSQPVLELGSGTGRIALALAQSGHRVIGLDRSLAMLMIARRRAIAGPNLRLAFVRADMRRFAFSVRFGLILIPLDGLLHLCTSAELLACLRCASAHLARAGRLVIDLAAPGSAGWEDWSPGARPVVPVWSRREPEGGRLTKYSSFTADASTQMHEVMEIYERTEPSGCLRRWLVQYPLRFIFPGELDLLLSLAGLRLYARYGDYDCSSFEAGSPRQIVIAEADRRRSRIAS